MQVKKYLCDDCALKAIESGLKVISGAILKDCNSTMCMNKAYFNVVIARPSKVIHVIS